MRICLVYDCLYPWTVGGAERWMRNVAEALVRDGHHVTYLTRLQWEPDDPPQIDGVDVIAVSGAEPLYGADGRRTVGEALRFGRGVLGHLLRHGREYDVVHTASFPYFSLLAAGAARRRYGYRLVSDWYEVWSAVYWREYLGALRAPLARAVQRACIRVRQDAFCFSELHAQRLRAEGLRSPPTVLPGMWAGPLERPAPRPAEPTVVFAGRLIAEKQAHRVVGAVVAARAVIPDLHAVIIGDGPQLPAVRAAIVEQGAQDVVSAPGFVSDDVLADRLSSALCLLLPSTREGYGLVVLEARAAGVPSVVVRGPDNAAVDRVEDGVNGVVAPDAQPATLAAAIVAIHERGPAMREATADWFVERATGMSIDASLRVVRRAYARR